MTFDDIRTTAEAVAAVSANVGYPARPVMREAELRDAALLRTGIGGGVIAALCCFTPVLVVLLGVVGLSVLAGWLDYVLLPALAFVAIAVYALWRRPRAA